MRHLLVLAHQRRGGDLGDHQARIQPRLLGEEGRQAIGQGRVDQQRDAALGDGADLADGKGDLVGGEGHRFGVEIAAGHDGVVGQDQRVVGHGIGFDFERAPGRAQDVETGAIDLRLTANAIGILHALVALRDGCRGSPSRPSSARSVAAVSIWPWWPRSVWMSGWNGADEPIAASVDIAPGDQRRLGGSDARGTGRPAPGRSRSACR